MCLSKETAISCSGWHGPDKSKVLFWEPEQEVGCCGLWRSLGDCPEAGQEVSFRCLALRNGQNFEKVAAYVEEEEGLGEWYFE